MLKIMTSSTPEIKVKDIDHCGIIAGIIDEMGLVEEIEQMIPQHGNQIVTTGKAVKAMILNGLGMISSPLYLVERFFEGKATEHLLGEGILPEHLNDDCLGRALDKLYQAGQTIPNQLGKPTASPTLRWVFQCFMSVHLVSFGAVKQISNLTSERSYILQFFSSFCRQYYLLS